MYAIRQNILTQFSLLSILAVSPTSLVGQTSLILRIGLVGQVDTLASARSIARGVRLGAAEANATATLFGGGVLLFEESAAGTAESAARRLLSQSKVTVLVGTYPDDADALSRFAEKNGVVFFNAASRASTLRVACRRHTFHVEASDSMYAGAVRSSGPRGDSALLWAASLEKYGASQINERFRAKYHLPMDGSAWAGWIAVKIVAEAALRARSTRAAALVAYLEEPSTSFDGHKGWPLSFRAGDHQLRQPLYVAAHSAQNPLAGYREVPQLSALSAAGANATELLDQIMPRTQSCRSRT